MRLNKLRSRLLLDQPWYGSLAMHLRLVEDPTIETMATNGSDLIFNPTWIETISDQELTGVIAHEILHCALRHMYRINGRLMDLWNIATDYAINQILIDGGFKLPAGALIDNKYRNQSADQIYASLVNEDQNSQKSGNGSTGSFDKPEDKKSDKGSIPGISSDNKPVAGNHALTETDWQVATDQAAAIASKAGKLPGGIRSLVDNARQVTTDWKSVLRQFIENNVASDYSWVVPNRRYISQGIYLPGIEKENLPEIAIAIDTSGSIDMKLLDIFRSEVAEIVNELKPETITVLYCNSQVYKTEKYMPEDDIQFTDLVRGGTRFQPVLDEITNQNLSPACLIYFTDLDGPTIQDPDYPILWVTTDKVSRVATYGETIRISS